ncbi:MAG: phospho-sugar mutase, partial [Candidatus Woesearchaeota archaeon]|nr:phospho-sugar mutase [Candidatus Woesearchaeota archaeon]
MIDEIKKVEEGFKSVEVSQKYKIEALKNIKKWLTDDMFKAYKGQIVYLIKEKKFDLLLDSFYQVIPFGTGGRRGPVGVGTNRMNPWTVKASAQGHSEYLLKQHKDAKERGIVIAYDVRKYPETGIYDDSIENPVKGITSKKLAQEATKVYTANGIKIYFFKEIRTTPELSFAIRHLKAIAGVNISASHNPKEDNGKKVYAADGSQLIPPYDEILADTVNAVKEINEKGDKSLIEKLGKEMDEAYLDVTTKLSNYPDQRDIKILFSPLHGVGETNVYATLERLGFDITLDPDTKTPDGFFTNIKFNIPNPEVPESMETCYKNAKGQELIISTDPDADRMGISVLHQGEWHYLNGNQIGIIALASLLEARKEKGELNKDSLVIKTLVTTSLLNKICKEYNVKIIDDLLVGFKYIANEIAKLEKKGKEDNFVIALEESHGYLTGSYCRDKDGVCA